MWQRLGQFVIKFRLPLLLLLFASSALMGYYASKVKLSYEFTRAIPTDNPKYKAYLSFKEKFGDDGNLLVIGIQSANFFTLNIFNEYKKLHQQLKAIPNVEDVLSIPTTIQLKKDSITEKLIPLKIFPDTIQSQQDLDSFASVFYNLPFYRSLLYNPTTQAYLIGVRINKDTINSPRRTQIVAAITQAVKGFEDKTGIATHLSGLPLIRTVVGDRIQKEMRFFLIGSILLSAFILLLFFRSFSTTLLSLTVVILGVVWSLGVLQLLGFKITLLTALVAPLVVVIGIPNCIYFINKYHTNYLEGHTKNDALVNMVSKMGVVTLFCNITAAIGFAVFLLPVVLF
jgi:predicted RND superfamily exporter protein